MSASLLQIGGADWRSSFAVSMERTAVVNETDASMFARFVFTLYGALAPLRGALCENNSKGHEVL